MKRQPRIPQATHNAVLEHRAKGRTDRQIEKMLGLTTGILSAPYTIGDDARPIFERDQYGRGWCYPSNPGEEN